MISPSFNIRNLFYITRGNLIFCTLIVINTITIIILLQLDNYGKIYLRNVLFSSIFAEKDLPTESRINNQIQSHFKRDTKPEDYAKYINLTKLDDLSRIKNDPLTGDRELAVAIIQSLGNMSDGRVCGLESLNKIVYDTERGMGCCSDYSKAWMFYAIYLGINVREVNSINHTTVEYLDRKTGQWHWIDPYNRIEIVGAHGQALSLYDIRAANLFDQLHYKRVSKGNENFDVVNYEGYAPSQLSVLTWRLGTNFVEIDRWDSRLRALGLPKSVRQLILLSTGVHPHWMILTTNALGAKLRALQLFLYVSFGLLALLNFLALWSLISNRRRQSI